MNYNEYTCPCGGRTIRRKVSTIKKGLFKPRYIFTYYYECNMCNEKSGYYQADITEAVRNDK